MDENSCIVCLVSCENLRICQFFEKQKKLNLLKDESDQFETLASWIPLYSLEAVQRFFKSIAYTSQVQLSWDVTGFILYFSKRFESFLSYEPSLELLIVMSH